MAYEREAIAPNNLANQTQPQVQMREERVVDPYRHIQKTAKIGQPDKISTGTEPVDVADPTKPAAESVSLSPAAAALARKEQKFRQEQASLKAKEAQLEKERLEIAEFKALKQKLDSKDYSAIEGMVPYDEYTNYHVNKLNGTSPEAKAITEVKTELEDLKKRQQEDITKRFEAAVNDRRSAVKKLVETDASYLGIKELKAEEAVVQHILDTWENDNIDLPIEKAAKEVEEIIKEREARWSALSKRRQPTVEETDKKNELPPLKPGLKTLTNNMNATGDIKRPQRSLYGLSDSERWAEARRRAEEKLKKG